jgi:hypothetical protein
LAEERTDFSALQTYRRLMEQNERIPEDIANEIASLFFHEGRADEWALRVYLQSFKQNGNKLQLLRGLAACLHFNRGSEHIEDILDETESLLEGIDEQERASMRIGFTPPILEPEAIKKGVIVKSETGFRKKTEDIYNILLDGFRSVFAYIAMPVKIPLQRIRESKRLTHMLKWGLMAVLCAGVVLAVINTIGYLTKTRTEVTKKVQPVAVPIIDPLTLQVAAYLKKDHAYGYAEKLKAHDLDVYVREAVGSAKTFYQVRISHFPDKKQAVEYGESLKARGVIDDYYVAKYQRP